jgi:two-component system phosphate regulon sensor histidine kinase PhoR
MVLHKAIVVKPPSLLMLGQMVGDMIEWGKSLGEACQRRFALSGECVLVVDDREENIEFIVDYVLKPHGYAVLVARDGEEGLRKALTENPDLILLDVQMPKMTGVEVLEALADQGHQVPVILMTMHGSEELAVHVFRLGVRDYVIKPFDVEELLLSIERALIEVRLRRERDALLERLMLANGQLERRVKELNILSSIGKSVAGLLDLERLLGRVVDAAVYITAAEEGWLMLVDEKTNELYVRAAKGLDARQARTLRLRVEDSLAGTVIKSGEPIVIGGGDYKVKTAYLVKSLIAVPLKIGQRTIGVLSVDYRVADRTFSTSALGLLSALGDYAAIAIGNARLFAQIEDGRSRLEAILKGTSDAILVADEGNRLLMLNRAAAQVLDLDGDAAVGQPVMAVIQSKELRSLFSQAGNGNPDLATEVPCAGERTFHAHLTPIPGLGYVVVMQNITHLKELESIKNEFVTTVSHDLRSPLTSIRGFVDLLEVAGPLNDQQQGFVAKIRKGTETITALTEDLLDLRRIETGAAFEFEPVSFGDILFTAVESLRQQAEAKHLGLDVNLPPVLPPVMGNRMRLGQAVENLVSNAIKYTPEGGQVKVWAQEEQGQLLVHVQDTGIGISAEDQTKIFRTFYRVKCKETRGIPGTGLGLAITKSIVERHDGRIWVDSELGKGSTFTFILPVHEVETA